MAPLDNPPVLDRPVADDLRFAGIKRDYAASDVARLRGSLTIRNTLAERGAVRLWNSLQTLPFVNALGSTTGAQAVQMVRAGLQSIYLSGWQVAADANESGNMYPDQSLYPANSVPQVIRRINKALQRADQIEHSEGGAKRDWFVPIVADAEAGFGGPLNAYELMKAMIEAGAAGVHFEDQLASEKKCGHLGGKVLVPIKSFVRTLNAARLAADVMDVPTVLIARIDAESAKLITSDIDERDHPFIDRATRTDEGFHPINPDGRMDYCVERAYAFAPYADLIWMETSMPNLEQARIFADRVHERFPGKMLAYNCSPSFNWKKNLSDDEIARFQREIGAMGYKYQFITLAGFHSLNYATFTLAKGYAERQMAAYAELQEAEFAAEADGYTATRHQREVGTGYFDLVSQAVSGGTSATTAMADSTETAQF